MELLYTAAPDQPLPRCDWLLQFLSRGQAVSRCAVSSRNLLAFSVHCGREHGLAVPHTGQHVLLADLNSPWDVHVVVSGSPTPGVLAAVVTLLSWHEDGRRLLVGWSDGRLQLLAPVDHHLNSWASVVSTSGDDGEAVIAATFFHSGRRIRLAGNGVSAPDVAETAIHGGIFKSVAGSPTLLQWGGQAADGFLALTAGGQLLTLWLVDDCASDRATSASQQPSPLLSVVERHTLTPCYNRPLAVADFSQRPCGSLLVAASSGLARTSVCCWKVSLQCQLPRGPLTVTVQQLPSVQLDSSDAVNDRRCVTLLLFSGHSGQVPRLLVATAVSHSDGACTSTLQAWKLQQETLSIISQSATEASNELPITRWTSCSGVFEQKRPFVALQCSREWLDDGYVLAASLDGQLFCLQSDSLQAVATACLTPLSSTKSARYSDGQPVMKSARHESRDTTLHISDACVSVSCQMAIAIDSVGRIHAWRLPAPDQSSGVERLLLSLEHCMLSGHDMWDILAANRRIIAESSAGVCDAWTERFQRLPAAVQQFHWQQHAVVRGWLLRLAAIDGDCRRLQEDAALLLLRCAAMLLRMALRLADGGDLLPSLLATKPLEGVTDVDKVAAVMRDRDTAALPDGQLLAQLPTVCQWVVDVCLQLLSSSSAPPRDRQLLQLLRELLVLVRRCGQLRAACAPVLQRYNTPSPFPGNSANADQQPQFTVTTDGVALLFRLVTRLVNGEPDATVAADCATLPPPTLADRLPLELTAHGYLVHSAADSSAPVVYSFYESTPLAPASATSAQQSAQLTATYVVDSLRQIRLGKKPAQIRRCCRCTAVTASKPSLEQSVAHRKNAVVRIWEQRWTAACLCGGNWVLKPFDT